MAPAIKGMAGYITEMLGTWERMDCGSAGLLPELRDKMHHSDNGTTNMLNHKNGQNQNCEGKGRAKG